MGLEIERSFYCINLYTATNGLYLEICGANCKCGIVYSAYRGFILFCNGNRLTEEHLGLSGVNVKCLEKDLGKEI